MICKKCGREVEEGMSFCPYCGKKVNEEFIVSQDRAIAKKTPKKYEDLSSMKNDGAAIDIYDNEKKTIGILAIVFGASGGWLGLLFGIIGLTKYKSQKNRRRCKTGLWLFGGVNILYLVIILVYYISMI